MKFFINSIFLIIIISTLSCEKQVEPPIEYHMNPNIILIKQCCPGEYWIGAWSGNSIYVFNYFRRLTLDNAFRVIEDSVIELTYEPPVTAITTYIAINSVGTKMLFVESMYSDVSYGSLYEFNLNSGIGHLVKDSTHNISSAMYYESDSTCVYYSYGNINTNKVAGYYKLNINSGYDSLLLSHFPDIGLYEVVNGFDINNTTKKLLIPLNNSQGLPKILEYDLISHTLDTLQINFDRPLLWLRSNNDGSKILYSNYPFWCLSGYAATNSEMGIIDTITFSKRILDVNTHPRSVSTSVFPNWSPDCRHIVFGSAGGPYEEPPGVLGYYSLYVLKNVD